LWSLRRREKLQFFGTDEVAPARQEKYLKVYYQYEPFWKLLSQEASAKVARITMYGSSTRQDEESVPGSKRMLSELPGNLGGVK
jgi:hypothetical protein